MPVASASTSRSPASRTRRSTPAATAGLPRSRMNSTTSTSLSTASPCSTPAACASPTRSTRASARPTVAVRRSTPTAFANLWPTCRRCGFRLCAATTPTTPARRRASTAAPASPSRSTRCGSSPTTSMHVVTLQHKSRSKASSSRGPTTSTGTRTARMAARAPPTTANVNPRGHGTTSSYVTKGYVRPADACLDCNFVGADAVAQLATIRQQPGFPAEMDAAIAAGHVYYGNAGVPFWINCQPSNRHGQIRRGPHRRALPRRAAH